MQYVLDTNVLIQAKNSYYGLETVPSFWSWLGEAFRARTVYGPRSVLDEIREGDDDLYSWIRDTVPDGFPAPSREVQIAYSEVANRVNENAQYGRVHIDRFLAGADAWVIAHARVDGGTVVTQERLVGTGSRKVKIPNVAQRFGVPYLDTFAMLRRLNVRL